MHKSTKNYDHGLNILNPNLDDLRKNSHEEYAFVVKKKKDIFLNSMPLNKKKPIFNTRYSTVAGTFQSDRLLISLKKIFDKKKLLFQSKFFGILENFMRHSIMTSMANSKINQSGNLGSIQLQQSNISAAKSKIIKLKNNSISIFHLQNFLNKIFIINFKI
jgi:hypothetical protein